MLNKKINPKSVLILDLFLALYYFMIDFCLFPQNSRRHFLKLLSSVVLYMCSPSARTWEGVRAFRP